MTLVRFVFHTNGRKELMKRANRRKDDGCSEKKVTAARGRLVVCEGDKLTRLARGNVNKKGENGIFRLMSGSMGLTGWEVCSP